MTIQVVKPPPEAYRLVSDAIVGLATSSGAAEELKKVNDPSKLSAVLPHKVYSLDADDIARGRDLNRARLIAWRFLILDGQTAVGSVELACSPGGGNLRFASFNVGPFVGGTRAAVRLLENLPNVRSGSFELRALRAPSVYAMAIWLKDLGGSNDIIFPLAPSAGPSGPVGGLPPIQTSSNFLESLKTTAEIARTFDSAPKPTTPTPGRDQ